MNAILHRRNLSLHFKELHFSLINDLSAGDAYYYCDSLHQKKVGN